MSDSLYPGTVAYQIPLSMDFQARAVRVAIAFSGYTHTSVSKSSLYSYSYSYHNMVTDKLGVKEQD